MRKTIYSAFTTQRLAYGSRTSSTTKTSTTSARALDLPGTWAARVKPWSAADTASLTTYSHRTFSQAKSSLTLLTLGPHITLSDQSRCCSPLRPRDLWCPELRSMTPRASPATPPMPPLWLTICLRLTCRPSASTSSRNSCATPCFRLDTSTLVGASYSASATSTSPARQKSPPTTWAVTALTRCLVRLTPRQRSARWRPIVLST